jgi:small-conductance mechanosensitive channel
VIERACVQLTLNCSVYLSPLLRGRIRWLYPCWRRSAVPLAERFDMLDVLRTGLATVIAFVPLLLLFLVILIVGLIVARLISKGLDKLLERVGFDRLVERGGVKKALEKSKFDASDLIAKIVYYALVLFVLQFAFGVFGPNPVSDLLAAIIAFLPRLIVAIIIMIIAAAVAAGAKTLIEGTLGGLSYGKIIANIASIFILFIGIIAALNQIGVATTVTTPILITVLAIIGGVIIVGAGGGLIKPMQTRWESILNKAAEEAPKVTGAAAAAPSIAQQAEAAKARAQAATTTSTDTRTKRPEGF